MKNELDSKFVLTVFDKITKHGQPHEHGYILDGVKAFTDHDGYTVFLEDALVSLQFGFHNVYHFNYQDKEHLAQFEKKLQAISSSY